MVAVLDQSILIKDNIVLFSLTDIDGLESSAIGGQLMASASTESPFTQSRRIDDSTVAGSDLVLSL